MALSKKGTSGHEEICMSLVSIAPSCVHMKYNRLNSDVPHVFHRLRAEDLNTQFKLLMMKHSAQVVDWFVIFPSGCVLEGGKEVVFNPDDDDFEHQLDLRMVCTLSTGVVFISVYPFTLILNGQTPNYPELVSLLQHQDLSPSVLLISHFAFKNTGLKTIFCCLSPSRPVWTPARRMIFTWWRLKDRTQRVRKSRQHWSHSSPPLCQV